MTVVILSVDVANIDNKAPLKTNRAGPCFAKHESMKNMTFVLHLILILTVANTSFAQELAPDEINGLEIKGKEIDDVPVANVDDETKIDVADKDAIANILSELKKIKLHKRPKIEFSKIELKNTIQFRKVANVKKLDARMAHAKELMGQEYRSYFKFAKLIKKPDHHVREYVKAAFAEYDKKSRVRAQDTARMVLSESKKYGFDPLFLLAVIENESRFDIKARGDAGEIGLMQILPDTGKWICEMNGWKWRGEKTLLDPAQNVKIGAAYLNLLKEKFESASQLYISAYNMGPGNVYKALSHQVTPKDYHSKVLEFYISYYRQIKKQYEDQTNS